MGVLARLFRRNVYDEHSTAQLMLAISSFETKKVEKVKALLAAKADPNAKDNRGRTALMSVVESSLAEIEVVKALLLAKADVNAKDNHGTTALMCAAMSSGDNVEIVKALLAAKAKVGGKNEYGYTALYYAEASARSLPGAKGRAEIVKLLGGLGGEERGSGKSAISAVRVVVESDVTSMFGAAVITPPAAMVQSIDQELCSSGHIRPGDFVSFIARHGFGQLKVVGCLTESERLATVRAIFPTNRWACCGRVTEMNRYNVIVAFLS